MDMLADPATAYQPSRSLPARVGRRIVQWRAAAPLATAPPEAMISFTFDDFPKSAADTGAEIIEGVGARACYYACSSMAGTRTVCGDMFDERDLAQLTRAGHEIGAHTRSHLDCARTSIDDIFADISQGLEDLRAMGHCASVRNFAYPFGETRFDVKRALAQRFRTARGVLSGLNRRGNDRMQLRAVELDSDTESLPRALSAIEQAVREKAWLVIFSHDVSESHGPWGVTPAVLRKVVCAARDAGLAFVTPDDAIDRIEKGAS